MMTDKRRHSIADGLTPEVKDKKKWSIESFSPLNIGATLHSKWKKKSTERIHPALKKHADDHDLFVKTSVSSRYNRRASVAVVSSETNSQLLLPDKLSCHHHGSVLSLWKKKMQTIPEPTGSPEMERRPTAAMYKRRASIAVTQLNTDHPVTFKPHKVKGKKGSKEYFMAVVHLHSGRSGVLTGEDGPGIESLLNQATMDQRINSYRLIMASTRAILDHDGTPKTPCVDPELDDVFEELGLQENPDCDTETDHRCEIVNDLLRTEREYGRLLGSILNTYAEPLRKFSSLTAEDHKVLFVGVEPVLSISAMLTSKLEDVLKTWVSSSSQIGNLFTSKFWNLYEEYLKNYSNTRKLLEDCYTSDQPFLEFCNVRKGQTTHKLESLLHLPVQRIPEYDKYLTDLLDETEPGHPDYEELSRASTRVKNMVKEHEDELGTTENQTKMDSIQLRFPNDDLQLNDEKQQKRTSSTKRRRSAPGAVLLKSLGKSKSSSNLWAGANMGKKESDLANPASRIPSQENRQFIMEGQVEFATGLQIQDRYMFLFNDLLLVAKQKTSTTFKLKHRVRVCEIWISDCVTDVTELTRSTELSFVMGWPLCNYVATFKTLDLKQQWLSKLQEQIENERLKEQPRVIKLKVVSREISEPCTLEVEPSMETQTVLRKCMDQSHLSDSDIKDYQLWVRYTKEDSPYPLIGHELPYSIKMSQLRDNYQSKNSDGSLPSNEEILDLNSSSPTNVEFILKHRKSNKKNTLDDSGKSMKKPRRSPFSIFRRGKDDKNNNSSPTGKLFGKPLDDLVTEEGLPKAVMNLMRVMYRDGPHTKGILRKSANQVKCKEVHDKLDEGDEVLDDNIQTLVVGAVLKEYLRSLPHCLLLEDYYNEWVALSEQDDSPNKMNKVKQLLYKIPPSNFDLLRHLICVLHHIQEKHSENMMTSYNLAVCITPSILWSKEQVKDPMANQTPHKAIMYLIDNCGAVFGEETLHLFGDDKCRDSSTDSDSMHSYLSAQDSGSGMRPDNSSIDSDLYLGDLDHSPNLVKSHLSPSNLSRDSGLTLSDAQLYDDDGSCENLTDKKNYTRSVSQYMDRDPEKLKYPEHGVSRSYDNTYENPKPPPRKNKRREFMVEKDTKKGGRNQMTQSYSAENYQKLKRGSCESLCSLENYTDDVETDTQFLHVRHPDFGTLTKSSSGAHLYLDENKESSNKNYVSEVEIQTMRQNNNGKLVRQSSVTESNPPMSPHSRLSTGSSFDSGIPHSLSCSSFLQGQASHESQFSVWSSGSDKILESQDDASIGSHLCGARRSVTSKKSAHFHGSPPVSPKTSHKVFNSDSSRQNVSVRRSFPLDYNNATKGSGSDSYKEAEDIIRPRYQLTTCEFNEQKDGEHLSPMLNNKYGSSASTNDIRQNMPMKAFTKYGLGTSPPPGVILRNHQKQHKREVAPMRASHDSAILSQVRRNSTDSGSSGNDQRNQEHHHSELIIPRLTTHSFPLVKSDSDSDLSRTLSSSPSRPDKPPSYDEACQRTFMIKHGIPLEISEQDSQKQKEASLLAKQLYEESLRKYMEEHLNSPSVHNVDRKESSRKEEVIDEKDNEDESSESSEEELIVRKKDPKKIYEESMRAYEQKSSNGVSDNKASRDSHLLSPSSLHRSYSDSSDKAGMWARRSPTREKSPLATDRLSTGANRNTTPSKQLNYSSSSVSNSSSETVTESQQIPPYSRDRSDSSPMTGRHFFPKTSDNIAQSYSAQTRRSSNEQTRDSSIESRYSIKSRESSHSQERSSLYTRDFEVRETTSKPRYLGGARSSSATNKFESKNSIVWKSQRDTSSSQTLSRDSTTKRDSVPMSSNTQTLSRDSTPKRDSLPTSSNTQALSRDTTPKRDTDLPWSVKDLRSVYDRTGHVSPSNSSETRPPPPPYQPPPPFRRDNARMSSSSNSSCSSSNTENSANISSTKSSVSHRRLGGPQARDSFSDDSDASSRSSGHKRSSPNHLSDHETWTYVDTEVTFV